LLACQIPEPLYAGTPSAAFPLLWSVYRWIDGDEVKPKTVPDWAAHGADVATAVQDLHGAELMGSTRMDELS
jgi:hypothetical protein